MKVTYDKKSNAMYIYLSEGKKSTRTEEVREDILVDFAGEEMVGIEILDASEKIAKNSLEKVLVKGSSPVYLHKISK